MNCLQKLALGVIGTFTLINYASSKEAVDTSKLELKLKDLATIAKRCGEKQHVSFHIDVENKTVHYLRYRIGLEYTDGTAIEFRYEDGDIWHDSNNIFDLADSFQLSLWKIRGRYLTDYLGGDNAHMAKSGGLWFCNLNQRPLRQVVSQMDQYADQLKRDLIMIYPQCKGK